MFHELMIKNPQVIFQKYNHRFDVINKMEISRQERVNVSYLVIGILCANGQLEGEGLMTCDV